MRRIELKTIRRRRRRKGIRKNIIGVPNRPRMAVYRSLQHIYVQVIDDLTGRTLASASTGDKGDKVSPGGNCAAAAAVGREIGKRAKKAGIENVVFDRGGRRYHGRIKALAEAAREAGLKF